VSNASSNETTLARIEALYIEIDAGRDNGGKRYTRSELTAMRREVARLRSTLT
jgi:hypothetical protein